MKKILVVAVIVLAATSLAPSLTRRSGTSVQAGNVETVVMPLERGWNRKLTALRGAESTSECLLTFITESLPDFHVSVPANFQIEVCCGTPPYHFEIIEGTLPEGLRMNSHGKITGKPIREADTTIFVTVTDSAGCSLTQAFAVRVVAP